MKISVGCTLRYQVAGPGAAFSFNVLAATDGEQRLLTESVASTPKAPYQIVPTPLGDRVLRLEAGHGPLELRYSAVVEVNRAPMPLEAPVEPPSRLPVDILAYTLPSRYCESDRFAPAAWEIFGKIPDRAEQVRAVCKWVDANVAYTPGSTNGQTSAWDVWQNRKGVCRDYTHVSIAFCRALSIPARYVGGYGVGLEPMNFHACFEAYLAGQWRLFDPTDSIAPGLIVVTRRGADAASAGVTAIFGTVQASPVIVECRLESEPASEPAAVEFGDFSPPAQSAGIRIA